jgi:flagellar biosynthesis/type III secretory pathway protein FliH
VTGVIKAASAGAVVRSFAVARPHQAHGEAVIAPLRSAAELALDEAHAKLDKAGEEIARQQKLLVEALELGEKAQKEAFDAGRKEGHRTAQDDIERRIASITKGAELAQRAWDERLAGLEVLAVVLARSALAKVFGEGADLADLVTRAIGSRVGALNRDGVVGVRVSTTDFPDAEALEAIRAKVGMRSIDVVADPAFEAGQCRLDLTLGHVDLGIDSQWQELDRFFGTLAAECVPA